MKKEKRNETVDLNEVFGNTFRGWTKIIQKKASYGSANGLSARQTGKVAKVGEPLRVFQHFECSLESRSRLKWGGGRGRHGTAPGSRSFSRGLINALKSPSGSKLAAPSFNQLSASLQPWRYRTVSVCFVFIFLNKNNNMKHPQNGKKYMRLPLT